MDVEVWSKYSFYFVLKFNVADPEEYLPCEMVIWCVQELKRINTANDIDFNCEIDGLPTHQLAYIYLRQIIDLFVD